MKKQTGMKVGEYVQQGDVLLKKVEKLPKGRLTPISTLVLQESETTGHHHHFRQDAAVEAFSLGELQLEDGTTTITPNMGKYIVVSEPSLLYHGKGFEEQPEKSGTGDHHALRIDPGTYSIDIVREYDYETNEVVRVVD